MSTPDAVLWTTTTHDWSTGVDLTHLDTIRRDPDTHAPGGLRHLILEVIATPTTRHTTWADQAPAP